MPTTTTGKNRLFEDAEFGLMPFDLLHGEPPRISSFTNFELLPASSVAAGSDKLMFVNTGSGAATIGRATKGGASIACAALANNAAVLTAVASTAFRPVVTATSRVIMLARMSVPTLTNVVVQAGLGQAPSATDPGAANSGTDSAEFFFDPANALSSGLETAVLGNWIARYRNASGTVSYINTGVPVVAGTDYNLMIQYNEGLQPVFWVNNEIRGVGTVGGGVTSGTTLITQLGVKTSSGARSFECRYIKIGRDCA